MINVAENACRALARIRTSIGVNVLRGVRRANKYRPENEVGLEKDVYIGYNR